MLKTLLKITPLLTTLTLFFLNQNLNWPCSLNPTQMREFQTMLRIFDARAKTLNLTYYLSEGTLLGAVRNGKTIPWTDDIDLKLLYDFEKVKIRAFSDLFIIRADGRELPIFNSNHSKHNPDPILNHTVFKLYSLKYFSSHTNPLYRLFNKAIYIDLTPPMHVWDPATRKDLNNITFDGDTYLKPKNSIAYLKNYYGVKFIIPADPACDHFNYCTNITPSYCRKLIPYLYPLLLLLSAFLYRVASRI